LIRFFSDELGEPRESRSFLFEELDSGWSLDALADLKKEEVVPSYWVWWSLPRLVESKFVVFIGLRSKELDIAVLASGTGFDFNTFLHSE
jgi:hypothetical protein